MVVIPIFGGLFAGALSLFWACRLGILPRFLLAALSASAIAMLLGLIVYFYQATRPVGSFARNMLIKLQKQREREE
jgi:hypothetical protein